MKYAILGEEALTHPTECLIIGVFENNGLTKSAKKIDKIHHGFINQLLKTGDFQGKLEQNFSFYQFEGAKTRRFLLVGCGKESALNERNYRKIIASSVKTLKTLKTQSAITFLTELNIPNRDMAWKIKQAIEVIGETLYTFNEFKSEKEPSNALKEVVFYAPDKKQFASYEKAVKLGSAVANGVEYTKNLANQPSNICTPRYLADQAKKLAKTYKHLSVKILEKADMKRLGMGALLAVAQGSQQDPKLICLEYNGGPKNQAPYAFVGKGITFDTGGISLKPAENMIGMKYDMCGAATVLGVIRTAAELKLPLNIVGLIAAAENMPSGTATKPEDIVTTMSGKTVEILNTDAEGRLVLSDALTYCQKYKPKTVIDIATLTGAVVIALGFHATGLISNNDSLANELLAAGKESFDRAWQMPLWEEYQDQLRSPFADMTNIGGKSAGVITSGCFLSRFVNFPWAHLDVAGTAAMMAGTDRFATGRPVPMLMQYLLNQV